MTHDLIQFDSSENFESSLIRLIDQSNLINQKLRTRVAALRSTGRCPTSERALTGVQVTETGILPTHALIDVVARGEPVLSTS